MAQFSQRLCFDLPYALARESEFLPDFLKGIIPSILQSKAQTQDARLTIWKRIQNIFNLFAKQSTVNALAGCGRVLVFHKIPQFRFFLFIVDGTFE